MYKDFQLMYKDYRPWYMDYLLHEQGYHDCRERDYGVEMHVRGYDEEWEAVLNGLDFGEVAIHALDSSASM